MNIYELKEKLSLKYDPINLNPETTALVLIDIQKVATGEFIEYEAKEILKLPKEEYQEALDEYNQRINKTLKNCQKILEACRKKGIRPIHVRLEAKTNDGADIGMLHKNAGFLLPKGNYWSQFCEETTPLDDEIVLTKICSGCHVGTDIDRILRNLGIKEVIVIGFYTDQCVTTTARDFSDLRYTTMVVEDAVNAMTQKLNEEALSHIVNLYVTGGMTDELVERIENL